MVKSVKPKSEIGPLPEIIVTALEKSKERRFLLDLELKILPLIKELSSGNSKSKELEFNRQKVIVPHKDLKNKYYRALLHKTCDYYKLARSEGLSYFSVHAREDINYHKVQTQIQKGGVTLNEIFDKCLKASIEELSLTRSSVEVSGNKFKTEEPKSHRKPSNSNYQHIQHQYFAPQSNGYQFGQYPYPQMVYYQPMYYAESYPSYNYPVFTNPYSSPYINPNVSTVNKEVNEASEDIKHSDDQEVFETEAFEKEVFETENKEENQ